MSVVQSIKKAREKGIEDSLILNEIRKQNPQKEPFFKKAEEMGANPEAILDEIIKQNSTDEEKTFSSEPKQEPISSPSTPSSPPPTPQPPIQTPSPKPKNSTTKETSLPPTEQEIEASSQGKTLLTKDAQAKEEAAREQFLKRIEAKERGEVGNESNFFSPAPQSVNSSDEEMTRGMGEESEKPKLPLLIIGIIAFFVLAAIILLSLTLF